jgi:hypothetical protein
MSVETDADIWSPRAARQALRCLWDTAYALDATGLTREGCAAMMPEYGEDIDILLDLAEDLNRLLRVRRLDATAEGRDHWRWFAMGRRP